MIRQVVVILIEGERVVEVGDGVVVGVVVGLEVVGIGGEGFREVLKELVKVTGELGMSEGLG